MKRRFTYLLLPLCFILGSCAETVSEGFQQSYSASLSKTVVNFEQKVNEGMSRKDVQNRMGEPLLQAKDDLGRDVWIYEQLVTIDDDRFLQNNENNSHFSSNETQTLTLNVKFDKGGKVRDLTNHLSTF
jgi:outer membrane protein assembly factor BamE (lipoprotein component of BamABCDE complex)